MITNAHRLRRTSDFLRDHPDKGAHLVLLSSGAVRNEGEEMRKDRDLSYLTQALARLTPDFPGLDRWRRFQTGYPGMDTLTAGLDHYALLSNWPLLTVVELSAGDQFSSPVETAMGLEGLFRNNGNRKPRPWEAPDHLESDFILLHSPAPTLIQSYVQGETPVVVQRHEALARHYGIPTVNLAKGFAHTIQSERQTLDMLVAEDGGLTAEGHTLAGRLLAEALSNLLAGESSPSAALPAFFYAKSQLVEPKRVPYEKVDYAEGWLDWQQSKVDRFFHVLRSNGKPGEIRVEVEGCLLAAQLLVEPSTGDLEVSLDGGAWERREVFREERFGLTTGIRTVVLVEGLSPERIHTVRIRVADKIPAGSKGRDMAIAWFFVDGDVVNADPQAGMSPLEVADAVYATMKPIDFQPPADRWSKLPKTKAKLETGAELRMVALGDSLVNDMCNSNFEHLLMRKWPGSTVRIFRSVRGSTGCWYYQQEGEVANYVTKYKPDLLVIGGISHRNDAEAVRSVIQQTRAALPGVETLLLTGPFGYPNPVDDPNWRERDRVFNQAIEKIAAEENVAFFDLQEAWADYIVKVAGALMPFKRDVVHSNDRGKQLLGRLFTSYLSPEKSLDE